MFKVTSPLLGGLLWYFPHTVLAIHSGSVSEETTANKNFFFDLHRKIPWRLSSRQKFRQRKRLRAVDNVVDTVAAALERNGLPQVKAVERWYAEMPREEEMLPKDKYSIYDRKEKTYRKGIHSKFLPPRFCARNKGVV
jgi:hypothetical protein